MSEQEFMSRVDAKLDKLLEGYAEERTKNKSQQVQLEKFESRLGKVEAKQQKLELKIAGYSVTVSGGLAVALKYLGL